MSAVTSDRCRNTQGFLTKNVKEIFWDLHFLSEVTGCRKTQVPLYKLNYPPFQILDCNHIPSCTSAGSVLQLCKVS